MWIFSTVGFFSITRDATGRGYQVRARDRRDLVRLRGRFRLRAAILATPRADYPYRMILTPRVWRRVAVGLIATVGGYFNFKDASAAVDPSRRAVLHDVWLTTMRLGRKEADDGNADDR